MVARQDATAKKQWFTMLLLVTSFVSSVSLVSSNGALFRLPTWQKNNHNLLLVGHLFSTWVWSVIAEKLGFYTYQPSPIPTKRMFIEALGGVGSILFMNLCMHYTTVTFYQITKLSMIPVQVALQWAVFGNRPTLPRVASLSLLCVGSAWVYINDFTFDTDGLVYCVLAVVITASYQAAVQYSQKTYQVSQFVYFRELSFLQFLIFVALTLLNGEDLIARMDTFQDPQFLALFFVSCFFAFLVNMTSAFIIGRLSALTYQVLGHAKTIAVLTVGILYFGNSVSTAGAVGMAVAGGGVAWYTQIELDRQRTA
eukprot:CAMPEP_0177631060 /NCGR_PEP_ID=MMETSP0447-20121125/1547_1 /TAXON_ID=0 /ORGANISM="Stygamoeba regulata, Strain BSH-02190019" /LENGTH=310 /DNA_ID=CAMNT_0019132517 /DNA_START=119 /DNA_END=1048 /DNA_ORIENTATION=-